MDTGYRKASLSLSGAISMGTGVMIGAGIFALTGQVAELAGQWFALAFLCAAVISGFSAYTYAKVSSKYPSAGGIAMILQKAYGQSTVTGACALMMAVSMIIAESLVARTFGTYLLQLLPLQNSALWVPIFAVCLIVAAFGVNLAGNAVIGRIAALTAVVKVGGIVTFAGITLWFAGFSFTPASTPLQDGAFSAGGFLAGTALAILAYKGFTTITNSGGELTDPRRNVGRAIVASLVICTAVYLLVAFAVGSSLTLDEIVKAKDYSLAEASRPALGEKGVWFTIAIALIATASGLIASIFAVSRMLTMLTEMNLIPHRHFGMPGGIQKHLVVYTVVIAAALAVLFDLSRIASLGAILYLVMDMVIHWGVFRTLRRDVGANGIILLTAIVLDAIVLAAFITMKWRVDPTIVVISLATLGAIVGAEHLFLRHRRGANEKPVHDHQ